ncbi:glycosyltransferase [Conexibacter woesei]|uniref:glycosyltransferase n=1 Tax=Conexibacter woesei TaxID=191495 RepID=UPI0004019FFE|nr:glycosyltransferase [Conexibacter woesei]
MRILIFHGYLLQGTGSNVYNALLAGALARAGHQVDLVCQERHPDQVAGVGAWWDWDGDGGDGGALTRRGGDPDAPLQTFRPDIGGVLPVYVADRYEGVEARPFSALSDAELDEYLRRNVAAVADVVALRRPDIALANHLVMGPAILARALGAAADPVPYAVKIHGSALEYTVKPEPDRFLPYAREGLAGARTILVGSRHTAESLWAAMDDPSVRARTRLGPPGVDIDAFRPRPRADAVADVRALAARLAEQALAAPPTGEGAEASSFARDPGEAARALGRLVGSGNHHGEATDDDRLVAFVGKLIVSKGVDLLIAAWPLVLAAVPDARLAVVGFGAYRDTLEALLAALARGDLQAVRAIAEHGRAAEGGPVGNGLRWLLAFLDDLEGAEDRGAYVAAASLVEDRVVLTGRLEHAELAPLLAACEAEVVPSTFPEAFGMVAAEAAACGALPVVAEHSGLEEVRAILAGSVPVGARPWLGFRVGDRAVRDLAERVIAWLQAPEDVREAVRDGLVGVARERFSWDGVAHGVVSAARGELDVLPEP